MYHTADLTIYDLKYLKMKQILKSNLMHYLFKFFVSKSCILCVAVRCMIVHAAGDNIGISRVYFFFHHFFIVFFYQQQ